MRPFSSLTALSLSLIISSTAAAEAPGFEVHTPDNGASVLLSTVSGTHVNLEAPMLLQRNDDILAAQTADDGHGVTWSLNPALTTGESVRLEFAVCDDAETWCKFFKIAFDFDPAQDLQATRQGSSIEAPPSDAGQGHHPGLLSFAIQDDADAAFEQATNENKLVLLDFHAVWCPPCQQLAAEGMADPDVRAIVDDLVVVQLDADKSTSWSAKSRYAVRGYPTVILARANGQEIARMEGYPGVADLHQWLDRGIRSGHSLRELAQMKAQGDRSPETLTALARALSDLGLNEEAASLYAEVLPALSGQDAIEAHLALLADAAASGSKRSLKKHSKALLAAPAHIKIVYGYYGALSGLPEGSTSLESYIGAQGLAAAEKLIAAPDQTPLQTSDALDAKGTFLEIQGDEAGAKVAYSQAADALLEALDQQPGEGTARFDTFRGPVRALTGLLTAADRPDEAEVFHKELTSTYTSEVTYFYDYARFLKGQERLTDAEPIARQAVEHAHGDNRLWATALLADILVANGKQSEAVDILTSTISETPLPDDPTIRTHRYVKRLEQQLSALEEAPQAAL